MELSVSAETLLRIFAFLLYAPIVLISYWKLVPRLSLTGKRIASGFLVAQVLAIAVAVDIRPSSSFEEWLWHLNNEWNIPNVLASTQLAAAGGAALMTARLAKARPNWRRLYLVGIGLLFLYIGLDEFFAWNSLANDIWKEPYKLIGAAVVVATAAVTARSPRRTWIWHLCLLTGLAVMALGGFAVDDFRPVRGNLAFLRLDGHLPIQFIDEMMEFLGGWLTLTAMLGQFSAAAPMPNSRVRHSLYALPAFWILFLFSQSGAIGFRTANNDRSAAAIAFESGVHLHGFQYESHHEPARLQLYLSCRQWDFNGLGYSVDLVDPISGEPIASQSRQATTKLEFKPGPGYIPIYRQWAALEIPPQAATNRTFWIVLRLWYEQDGERVHQRVLDSDHPLLDDTQVVLGELRSLADSPSSPQFAVVQ